MIFTIKIEVFKKARKFQGNPTEVQEWYLKKKYDDAHDKAGEESSDDIREIGLI